MHGEVIPTGAAVGAELRGLDLAQPLTEMDFELIKQAWLDHSVLLFRGQFLDDEALIRFSKSFGKLEMSPASANASAGGQANIQPEIWIISNVVEDGQPIGALGDKEADWHTDMSYVDEPPMASILYSLEVPKVGGNTSFANMYKAFETLPTVLREAVLELSCHHDSSTTSVGETRAGFEGVWDVRDAPGATHPMVRAHPETGGLALYLGRRRNAYIPGLDLEDSEDLLDELWAHCTKPEFTWTHRWREGDVVMWDNRCLIHRREAFSPRVRRVMHRTQISGDKPR
ncbi:MAG: TauD/TfdA family dioxygenase [Parvibaculaceae bacterium]|nr:TauD/TfdA family dioxygenase [Parvibaculaceae bacterium]